jgi:hypothetical protein
MPSITPINFSFLEKRMKKGMREGGFHVNERKQTHTVWFYLERRNKGEINLGVIMIGGWDWRRVYLKRPLIRGD